MTINDDTRCCATQEIDGLQDYSNPKEAIKGFLTETCLQAVDYYSGNYNKSLFRPTNQNISAFYYFTGVMAYTDSNDKHKYAQKFSAFIKKEKLGKVVFGGVAVNRLNHPTHLVGVWVWRPSIRGLQAYISRNKLNQNL